MGSADGHMANQALLLARGPLLEATARWNRVLDRHVSLVGPPALTRPRERLGWRRQVVLPTPDPTPRPPTTSKRCCLRGAVDVPAVLSSQHRPQPCPEAVAASTSAADLPSSIFLPKDPRSPRPRSLPANLVPFDVDLKSSSCDVDVKGFSSPQPDRLILPPSIQQSKLHPAKEEVHVTQWSVNALPEASRAAKPICGSSAPHVPLVRLITILRIFATDVRAPAGATIATNLQARGISVIARC